jgi:hypothetical protein
VLAVLCALAVITGAQPPVPSHVVELNSDTFNDQIASGPWLVKLYVKNVRKEKRKRKERKEKKEKRKKREEREKKEKRRKRERNRKKECWRPSPWHNPRFLRMWWN